MKVAIVQSGFAGSGCYPHEERVADKIEEIEDAGWEVARIDRISRSRWCNFIGEDVTYIYYQEPMNE